MKKLDLKEWAAVAEIVGTVAVIVSLLIVSNNIRQNTKAVQATNDTVLYEMTDSWYADVAVNPELAELMIRYEAGEQLTDSEHRQISYHISRTLNQWELAFVRFEQGLFPPKQWESWNHSFEVWLPDVYRQQDWENDKETYYEGFAAHVDAIYLDH